ncbi:MAG: N-formylglutamate amidohydrolase [Rhodobacteraceae bacterium]|nr:N-formylglutamate amidohydrolase [Paracoccaceae bacterium]
MNTEQPFEILKPRGSADILICVEHAGKEMPPDFDNLGLPQSEIDRHIGWDIGVGEVARAMHQQLGQPLILGRYSRLVVDLNRPVHSAECISARSDGTDVPGNRDLTPAEKLQRMNRYYRPFHLAVSRLITSLRPKVLLSVHSFTPKLRQLGVHRPWHCGVLYDENVPLGMSCLRHLADIPGLVVGDNEPYRVDHTADVPLPLHGELKGVPSVLVEIRNDVITGAAGQRRWAEILSRLVDSCLLNPVGGRSRA